MNRGLTAIASRQASERVRAAADLAAVVQHYIKLRPAGTNRLAGQCPFHDDQNPSLKVDTQKQLWHCFGCGAGGDVYTFVQAIEGVSFIEARKILAEQYGIPLEDHRLTCAETALTRGRRTAAERLAPESSIWWRYVRQRYQSRYNLMVASATMASDADNEVAYTHYSNRAWRWGGILRKLDSMEPGALRREYRRVRTRGDVVAVVAAEQAIEQRAKNTWDRIIAAADRITSEQCSQVTAAMYAAEFQGAAGVREILRGSNFDAGTPKDLTAERPEKQKNIGDAGLQNSTGGAE